MQKILILGSTGLLGNAVERYFRRQKDFHVTTACRNPAVGSVDAIRFDALYEKFETFGTTYDYVLNCVGIIKPFMVHDPLVAIEINAAFPWRLARWCTAHDMKLIHITTDCVFSGTKGKYVESDLHDALDPYGKSKSLGECSPEAMLLRTSIIGEEMHKNASLVAWVKSQKGKSVGGYATHFWNGITTNEYAVVCAKIMRNNWYEIGCSHVFAANDVSKFEMLCMFDKKYQLNLTIEEAHPPLVDRTLRTEKILCAKLGIPTVQKMIEDMN